MTLFPAPLPLVVAPMAGGPTTPELVAAASGAGAFGFLAGGYLTPEAFDDQLTRFETLSDRPYGVNLFVPSPASDVDISGYTALLAPVLAAAGVEAGEQPRADDAADAELGVLLRHRPAAVSFTFGLPSARAVATAREIGASILVTVTTAAEARAAAAAGADALVAQGAEAGGHRGVFVDDGVSPGGGELVGVRDLVRQVRAATGLPVVAAGGLATGADVADVLALGAAAAQLGTVFLGCPEAGTSATHRAALHDPRFTETVVTRAFTGRPARGLRNAFADRFGPTAPAAYPQVHHLTRPLRRAAARDGRPEELHLWAGTGWREVRDEPVAEVVARLERERAAVTRPAQA